jgi:protein gp37
MPTKIEWTQGDDGVAGETWNVVRGCSRVSPGCGGARGEGGCYAERQAIRQAGPGRAYEGLVRIGKQGPRWTGKVILVKDKLVEPFYWRKGKRIFVNSMSDLFHEGLTNKQIAAIFGIIACCPQHTFQILTKRAERMRAWFAWVEKEAAEAGITPAMVCIEEACNHTDIGFELHKAGDRVQWPLPNVWMGVSVEDQKYAEERIPDLLLTPAAVRFVSYEPALGPVAFFAFLKSDLRDRSLKELGTTGMPGLDWIIVGGESGPGSRPFHVDWARSVVRECEEAKVACFVKQLGRKPVSRNGGTALDDGPMPLVSRKGNDMEEWPMDLRVRQWPGQMAAAAS